MFNEWQSVTTPPPLDEGELQLWKICLGDATEGTEVYRQHLSSAELDRADRLREGQVRLQFLVAKAALRILLGNLLNLSPALVPIILGAYGKPEIPSGDGLRLFFNVAHSRDIILIALSRSGKVGIDVEHFDRKVDPLDIARHSFTSRELTQIEGTSDPVARQRAFFHCWTRKEAVIKADGRGLSLPLNLVEVPVEEPADASIVSIDPGAVTETGGQIWFVTDIELGEETAAAFAVEKPHLVWSTFNFPLALLPSE